MARNMVQLSTRSCCGEHRWPLMDMVETLAASGFEYILLEEIAFAGERVGLTLPVETDLRGNKAQSLVDTILQRLSQTLGSNALCFTGNLTVTASAEADEIRAQEILTLIKSKGLSCCLKPRHFSASTQMM